MREDVISEGFREKIEFYRKEYNNNVSNIPELDIRDSYGGESFAKFNVEDLYNKRYVLYVNKELEKHTEQMTKQILYHEFTHLEDSLKLLDYDLEKFKKLMNIYSEVHASERKMDELLKTQKEYPYSLEQEVTYNIVLPLKDFMRQILNGLENDFIFNKHNIANRTFNYKRFYYFVGYVVSLKKHDIEYQVSFKKIDVQLAKLFIEIIDRFIKNNYDDELLIQYENQLVELILYKVKEGMGLLNCERNNSISCPQCGSIRTKVICNRSKAKTFWGKKLKDVHECLKCSYKWKE